MSSTIRPPRLAHKLLLLYAKNACIEDLEGDLEEMFLADVRQMPRWKANVKYYKRILSLLFSYAVRRRKQNASIHSFATTNNRDLVLNYVMVASRNLAKHRFFTVINVIGLAVGMSISLLFIAMMAFVEQYDEFHVNKERIYRINTITEAKHAKDHFASSPPALAERIENSVPNIDATVRINKNLSTLATIGTKEVPLQGYFAEEKFLAMFSFPLVNGNPAVALLHPHSILITEKAAHKAFGDDDPMGKIITMGPWGDFEVTGVLKDHPKASHLQFEVIASYSTLSTLSDKTIFDLGNWEDFRNNYTYILLRPSSDITPLENVLAKLTTSVEKSSDRITQNYRTQPLSSIATTELSNQIGPEWGQTAFMIFGVLTLLILLPACFNYTNISISRTLKRAKEIGLRKTVGGQRGQIFFQFLTETIILSLIALAGAILIFTYARSEFLSMLVSQDALELSLNWRTLTYFVIFAIATGFFAGIVPGFYFSKINPVQALKNTQSLKAITGLSFQKTLMVVQFALSLGFIMGVVIVLKQYQSSLNYDFGFQQENILNVDLQGVDPVRFEAEFSRLASVKTLSLSSDVLGAGSPETVYLKGDNGFDSVQVAQVYVSSAFIENFGMTLLAGTNFSSDNHSRERQIIINEEMLKKMGLQSPREALGKTFLVDDTLETEVVGVIKNFHYTNLREPIGPFAFRCDPNHFRFANLQITTPNMHSTFEELEAAWSAIGSETKFRSRFLSDEIEDAYSFYFSLIKICGFLGFLAITISCLGLLGMVVYSTESRMKELGVRKVMGASSYQLAILLSKTYLKLMVMASVIATPLTYLIFDKGMLQFQYYRFEIGIIEIVVSLLIMFILGGATILSQTIKAGSSNPVDTLKYE